MDDTVPAPVPVPVPSITSAPGTVGSRFVSQDDIDSAKSRRDEQWRAAYARLGQEPPPQPTEDVYDGRSLAEKLAANKIAKQEEWEEKTKLANQFRALEEDEVLFLDSLRNEEEKKELKRKREDAEEVKGFMEAVAARNSLPEKPSASTSPTASTAPSKPKAPLAPPPTAKKSTSMMKNTLKGVVVKKKPAKVVAAVADGATGKDDKAGKPESSSPDSSKNKKQKLSSSSK